MGLRLAICMPTHGPIPVETALCLAGLTAFIEREPSITECKILAEGNYSTVEARYRLTARALDFGADFLLWIDSDMTFPKELFHRLYRHKKLVVACNYLRRFKGGGPVAVDWDDNPIPMTETGLTLAKATGFGAVLIHSDVFRQMQPPWFRHEWVQDTGGWRLASDDGLFFKDMRDKAFENLWLDCSTSQLIGHVGSAIYGGPDDSL